MRSIPSRTFRKRLHKIGLNFSLNTGQNYSVKSCELGYLFFRSCNYRSNVFIDYRIIQVVCFILDEFWQFVGFEYLVLLSCHIYEHKVVLYYLIIFIGVKIYGTSLCFHSYYWWFVSYLCHSCFFIEISRTLYKWNDI